MSIKLSFPIVCRNTIASNPNGSYLQCITHIEDGGWCWPVRLELSTVYYEVRDPDNKLVHDSGSLLSATEAFDKVSS